MSEISESKLLPCAFCISNNVETGYIRSEIYPRNDYLVYCKDCNITVGDFRKEEQAIAAWNCRVAGASA